jgi:Domain of unknown function (DU1801)
MAEIKTQKNDGSVNDFIAAIEDDRKREDSKTLLDMMQRVTREKPEMWGTSIIGFGDHHYKYETGREGDWFKIGFSPRKQNLTLYVMGYITADDPLFTKLGKFTTSMACLYIKRLEDVDTGVLEKLVKRAYENVG